MIKISSVLHYCTNEFRFLETQLKQLSKVSDEIIIPLSTHLYCGELENSDLVKATQYIVSLYPKARIVEFPWEGHKDNAMYYDILARKIGTEAAKNEWILHIDVDEIVDDTFTGWLKTQFDESKTYWFTCNWYFRSPKYQAIQREAAGLLIRKELCNWNLTSTQDRQQLFNSLSNLVHGERQPILVNNEPMIHHYSWVRSQEEMLRKVQNWGHRNDKDWINLVLHEFTRPFNGKDFVHGYTYKEVDDIFKILPI